MNIFILDYNPVRAARAQCDKHIVKMPLETAQILCAAFKKGSAPYKQTHYNHPCTVWSRQSEKNYRWLIEHGLALCDEYTFRYGKIHKSRDVILWCKKNIKKITFPRTDKTHFELCFSDEYKVGNAVDSYRAYYRGEKSKIATWKKRKAPNWFTVD